MSKRTGRILSALAVSNALFLGLLIFFRLAGAHATTFDYAHKELESNSFNMIGEGTNDTYLPFAFNPPGRLYGYITQNGLPAQDVTVTLEFCKNYELSPGPPFEFYCLSEELHYAATNDEGFYQFLDMPTLVITGSWSQSQTYQINWQNPENDLDLLSSWTSRLIDDYSYGDVVDSGSFDISNVYLNQPVWGTVIREFPVTFSWSLRDGVVADNFRFCLSGGFVQYPVLPPDSINCDEALGTATSFTIDAPFEGIDYGYDYWWRVFVDDATGGSGVSHSNRIQFAAP